MCGHCHCGTGETGKDVGGCVLCMPSVPLPFTTNIRFVKSEGIINMFTVKRLSERDPVRFALRTLSP